MAKILAVVPSDPIKAYMNQGLTSRWLEEYYNPKKYFDKVYLLSPLEKDHGNLCGMTAVYTDGGSFKKNLRRLKVGVVRAYGGYWAADLACLNKIDGVPVIVSIHDRRESLINESIKEADYLFCTSKVVRDVALKKFFHPEKAWILPNRVDFDVMKPSKRKSEELRKKLPSVYTILHIGRKSKEKNLETVIRSLPLLGKEYVVVTIGSGDEKPYKNLAKKLGVSKQVYFIHHVNNHELPKYYNFCDCMCTPSLSEGFGIVFIEALACKTVVVTSDVAPMNEYIKDNYNGVLVKEYTNPEKLAEKIKLACENKNLRNKIKANARKSIARFSKTRIDDLEVKYYSKILQSSDKQTKVSYPFFRNLLNIFK